GVDAPPAGFLEGPRDLVFPLRPVRRADRLPLGRLVHGTELSAREAGGPFGDPAVFDEDPRPAPLDAFLVLRRAEGDPPADPSWRAAPGQLVGAGVLGLQPPEVRELTIHQGQQLALEVSVVHGLPPPSAVALRTARGPGVGVGDESVLAERRLDPREERG